MTTAVEGRTAILCAIVCPCLSLLVIDSARGAAAEGQDEVIEEIQVTATRRPVAAADVTAAVTLVDGDAVRNQKLVTDALAARPGVFLQQTTPGQGAAIIRGLKGSEILHLVDGLRMNNAIFRNAPTQYLALISPATVERVEILRGSPASLYGSDAVGGVVQVISRMPRFDEPGLGLRREMGIALDSAEAGKSAYAALDLGNDRVAGLLSANYLDTGDRRIGGGERVRPSGYSARSFRGALAVNTDDDSRWSLDLQYGHQPKTPRVDELVAGFGEAEPASAEFFFAPNERRFVRLQRIRNGGLFGADWRVDLGWQKIIDDRITRSTGSDRRQLEQNASDLFGLSVTASGEHAAGSWVAGAELYHDAVSSRRQEFDVTSGQAADVESRFPDGSTVDQAAVFVNADYDLSDRQALSGGVRVTAIDVDLAATSSSPAAGVDLEDFSADFGWRFDLTDSTRLTANAGLGFRAPNVFDLGTLGERPGNRFNIPNIDLQSEHITQLDLGLRHRGERIGFEVVVWRFDYDDRIVSVLTGATTADGRDVVQTQNRASAELWGVEGLMRFFPGERWTAELVLNYTRGEQDDSNGVTEPADRVPPLNGRLSVEYEATPSLIVRPAVLFAAKQDRLSDRDILDSRIDPTGTDGWISVDLEARWRPSDRWYLRLAASNILDERYRMHGSGIDAPGRNLALDLRYVW